VQLLERPPFDLFHQSSLGKAPVFPGSFGQDLMRGRAFSFTDPSGLYGKYFAPTSVKNPTCGVPPEWGIGLSNMWCSNKP